MISQVYCGDSSVVLKSIPDASVDAVITDPPYGLALLGKEWDKNVPEKKIWSECKRILKPGGFLLAFGAPRTIHITATRIEEAGLEIRDQIIWMFGEGFPKGAELGKKIDKSLGIKREQVLLQEKSHVAGYQNLPTGSLALKDSFVPVSDEAKAWDGWSSGLKPAHEPIVVARKHPEGSMTQNVLKYGCGAMNINRCRIETTDDIGRINYGLNRGIFNLGGTSRANERALAGLPQLGRWPANVIHDGDQYVLDLFPETDKGSAARYFYCAKASPSERRIGVAENKHLTVKPIALMRHLCQLVTQPGGIIVDPFCGSGSTGCAAMLDGFSFIGIELQPEFAELSRTRIAAYR